MTGKTIVTIACSFGERYLLSTPLAEKPARKWRLRRLLEQSARDKSCYRNILRSLEPT